MTDEQRKQVDDLIESADHLRIRSADTAEDVQNDYRASIATSNIAIAIMLRDLLDRPQQQLVSIPPELHPDFAPTRCNPPHHWMVGTSADCICGYYRSSKP